MGAHSCANVGPGLAARERVGGGRGGVKLRVAAAVLLETSICFRGLLLKFARFCCFPPALDNTSGLRSIDFEREGEQG